MNRIILLSFALMLLSVNSIFAQKVGIGTNTPTERLHVNGNFRLDGEFKPNNDAGQPGQVLKSRGGGLSPEWGDAAGGADIQGTVNYLARFTSATALRIGQVQDDNTQVLIKRTAGLPTADLNAYFTVEAPGTLPGVNNQRVALKAVATDSSAVLGMVIGATANVGIQGVSRSTSATAIHRAVFGTAAFDETIAGGPDGSANFAWANVGATTSTNTGAVQTAPTGGFLSSTGVMGFGGTEGFGVTGFSSSNEIFTAGVFGLNTNLAAASVVFQSGVFGETANQMYGVIGLSSFLENGGGTGPQTGAGIGVSGRTLSGGGTVGVEGFAIEAPTSQGTAPNVNGNPATYGVLGRSSSTSDNSAGVWGLGRDKNGAGARNYGVLGEAFGTADSSAGVRGRHTSTNGYGVFGSSFTGTAVMGAQYGVDNAKPAIFGSTLSTTADATAVLGYAKGATAIKSVAITGWNEDFGADAAGVIGETFSADATNQIFGVVGKTAGTNANSAGVRGEGPSWAGWFEGKVRITGDLECNGANKLFVIDHPLDPANKYLKHACVESNEVLNIYSGTITTAGADNTAIVKLPDYFEALNTDFRYQLTCINQFANAIVSKEISSNTFVIKTDKPNVKVSWVVYAKRNDILNRQKPFVAEQLKEPENRGKYLSAQAYKMPSEMQIGYMKPTAVDPKLRLKPNHEIDAPAIKGSIKDVDDRLKQMEIDLLKRNQTPTNIEVPKDLKQFIPTPSKNNIRPLGMN